MNSGGCSQTSSWKLPIALKLKMKQNKNLYSDMWIFAFAKELLRASNDCNQKVSQFIAVCVVHS